MQTLAVQDIVLSEKDFSKIRQLVYDHCGINLHEGKKELGESSLRATRNLWPVLITNSSIFSPRFT